MSASQAGPSHSQTRSRKVQEFPKVQRTSKRPGPVPPRNHNPSIILTCQAIRDFAPRDTQFADTPLINRCMPMKQDDELFAIGDPIRTKAGALILVSYGDSQREGLVPLSYLQKGTPLRDVQIREFAPQFTQPATNPNLSGTVLFKTIDGLLSEFVGHRDILLQVGCNLKALDLAASDRHRVRDVIYDNIPKDVSKILKDGNASWENIVRLPATVPDQNDRTPAIYLMVYDGIPDQGHGVHGMYAGKTINLLNRYSGHMRALKPDSTEHGSHYAIGRKASRKKMVAFTTPAAHTPELGVIFVLAEQIAQLLFGTYNPVLFKTDHESTADLGPKWVSDSLQARTLKSLAEVVFQRTGWKPPRIHGCNWLSALAEEQLPMSMWLAEQLRDENGHDVMVFSTGGKGVPLKPVTGKSKALALDLIHGGTDNRGNVQITISDAQDQGLQRRMRVYPIVEFYLSGQNVQHPAPYARMPEPGPFSDWYSLNKLGIRIEWQMPDGEWRSRYVQTGHGPFSLPKASECKTEAEKFASELYTKTSCIIDTFMNVVYNGGNPSFKRRGPPLLLKQFVYNHLHQEIFLRDLPPAPRDAPTLVSYRQNKDIMRQLYPDLVIGDYRPEGGLNSSNKGVPRAICDFCSTEHHYARMTSLCPVKSDRGDPTCGDLESCPSDEFLRRPCFWQRDVPREGVHRGAQMPAHMAKLFVREAFLDYWVIDSPMHVGQGIKRDQGPTIDEAEDAEQSVSAALT